MKLIKHPGSPPSPAESVEAVSSRLEDGKLSLVFEVTGEIGRLRVPTASSRERKDGLWRHSCFEAFVRLPRPSGYVELNVSPSGDWAAYCFENYRAGMAPAEMGPPAVKSEPDADHLRLSALFDLSLIARYEAPKPWHVGLSAVIEADDGSLSYWALAHPAGAPDFHHPDCFVLELPSAGEP